VEATNFHAPTTNQLITMFKLVIYKVLGGKRNEKENEKNAYCTGTTDIDNINTHHRLCAGEAWRSRLLPIYRMHIRLDVHHVLDMLGSKIFGAFH
jgi:hypothetical protein